MPQIQNTFIGRSLQRLLGLEGSSPIPTVSPELVGVVQADDASLPEFWDPNEKRIAGGFAAQAAGGAGTYSLVALVNPANSGILATMVHCAFWASAGASIYIRTMPSSGYTPTSYGYYRDTRVGGRARCGLYSAAPIVLPGNNVAGRYYTTTLPVPVFDHPIVIGPGDAVIIGSSTANLTISASILWRERLAKFPL